MPVVVAGVDPLAVKSLVSAERFRRHLLAAGDDDALAVALYEWNAAVAAACFEVFHYVEIIVRNSMDKALSDYFDEKARGIPWFMLPVVNKREKEFAANIEKVRERLRRQGANRETRDQVLAGVDFGFWTALLHTENEELWRQCLRRAFPYSPGTRKDVVNLLETLRIFRNKLAHHDSLLAVDLPFRLRQMKQILGWIDPAAEAWVSGIERVSALHGARPVARADVVVVAARQAWPLYQAVGAYICQPGRTFRPVRYMAFYTDREIKPELASIRGRYDNVEWTEAEQSRLGTSSDPVDRRLAATIGESRRLGWAEGRYQAFILSAPGDEDHVTLPAPIRHERSGKGAAFVRGQRYTRHEKLESATSTADLT